MYAGNQKIKENYESIACFYLEIMNRFLIKTEKPLMMIEG